MLLFGIGGAYPAKHLRHGLRALHLGELCVVERDRSVDDGVLTPDGFIGLDELGIAGDAGFGANAGGEEIADPELTETIAATLDCPRVVGATVSTGAGTDPLSQAYALRSGAQIESMEGAAVAAVCRQLEVPFAQLRAVSNLTGTRDLGAWAVEPAVARLELAIEALSSVLP